MKPSYDAVTDSLYIHLSERTSTDSDKAAEGVVLDYADDGVLVRIDVQHASKRADTRTLTVLHLPIAEMHAA